MFSDCVSVCGDRAELRPGVCKVSGRCEQACQDAGQSQESGLRVCVWQHKSKQVGPAISCQPRRKAEIRFRK